MTSRPITWPYGGRFKIIRADRDAHTVTIEGKRWPWSRPEVVTLEHDGNRFYWSDTQTQMVLATANVFEALLRATGAS